MIEQASVVPWTNAMSESGQVPLAPHVPEPVRVEFLPDRGGGTKLP